MSSKNLTHSGGTVIASLSAIQTISYTKLSNTKIRVNAKAEIKNTSTWNFTLRTSAASWIKIDGTQTNQSTNVSVTSAGTRTVVTASRDYEYTGKHNPVTVEFFLNMKGNGINYGSYSIDNLTINDSFIMPTLNGASTIGMSDTSIGSTGVVSITKYASTNKDTVTYKFGSLSGTLLTDSTEATYSWTIPESFYNQIPNAKSGTGTFTTTTKDSAGNVIGTNTSNFTVIANEAICKPKVSSFNCYDENTVTTALTGNNKKIINGYSNVRCITSCEAQKGSTIKSIIVTTTNASKVGTNVLFENAISSVFSVTVIDSRDYKTVVTSTGLSLIDYFKVTIASDGQRENPTNGNVLTKLRGNYYNGYIGATYNQLSVRYRYKSDNDNSYSVWFDLYDPTININSYTMDRVLSGFSYKNQYQMEFEVFDKITKDNVVITIPPGIPMFWWDKDTFTFINDLYMDKSFIKEGDNYISMQNVNAGSHMGFIPVEWLNVYVNDELFEYKVDGKWSTGTQGFCSDNTYFYYIYSPNHIDNNMGNYLYKIRKSDGTKMFSKISVTDYLGEKKQRSVVKLKDGINDLNGHCNGMSFYNSELYIVNGTYVYIYDTNGNYQRKILVSKSSGYGLSYFCLVDVDFPFTSQKYTMYYAFYGSSLKIEIGYALKTSDKVTDLIYMSNFTVANNKRAIKAGLSASSKYIFIGWSDYYSDLEAKDNYIDCYTLGGNYIGTFRLKNTYMYEIEDIDVNEDDGIVYVSEFYGKIYKFELNNLIQNDNNLIISPFSADSVFTSCNLLLSQEYDINNSHKYTTKIKLAPHLWRYVKSYIIVLRYGIYTSTLSMVYNSDGYMYINGSISNADANYFRALAISMWAKWNNNLDMQFYTSYIRQIVTTSASGATSYNNVKYNVNESTGEMTISGTSTLSLQADLTIESVIAIF